VVKLKTYWRKRQYVDRYSKGDREKHKASRDYERRKKGDNRQNSNVDNEQVTVKKEEELNRKIKKKNRHKKWNKKDV
jgi:hypothetical protein